MQIVETLYSKEVLMPVVNGAETMAYASNALVAHCCHLYGLLDDMRQATLRLHISFHSLKTPLDASPKSHSTLLVARQPSPNYEVNITDGNSRFSHVHSWILQLVHIRLPPPLTPTY